MKAIDYTRLEVSVGGTWTNITGSARNISITRGDGDVGLMSAEVLNSTLDPVTNTTLRLGREVRVMVKNGASWSPEFVGRIDDVSVDYDPLASGTKTANIKITASDAVSLLANAKESRGVGSINDLRWIVVGVPFNINGATTALGAGTVVATNDNASLWDQILVTRDSNLGYAWVDKAGTLRVFDNASMDTAIKGTFNSNVYAELDIDFSLDQIINSVTVQWLRYNIGTETATAVAYGPYEDATSIADWGVRSATFTVQGATEVEANIAAFANDVLTRNKNAEHRAKTATVPVRYESDLALVRNVDLNSRVSVVYTDGTTTKTLRVVGIKHTITGDSWTVEYEFALPNGVTVPSVSPDTGIGFTPPGSIGADELDDDVNADIATGVDAAALAQQALEEAEASFNYAETKNQTYYQATQPTAGASGDIWFDTDDGNKVYVHNGSTWQLARDTGIAQAITDAGTALTTAQSANVAANNAQSTANTAQTTANNKNKVTYSTSAPGSTANTAGDIWFVKDGSNTITAQYEGTGGTSWVAKTLNNSVIANLDAGKITAGSTFTNSLNVKSTFTLGDASVNGIIQSFNYAGSATGVLIDKFGLTAKGGAITGASIKTQTGSNGITMDSSGIVARDNGGNLKLQFTTSTGELLITGPVTTGGSLTGASVTASSTGVIQTESTNSRGIKMNSAGFTAYDSGGNPTFTITASTGAVAMKGELTTGSSITGANITASSFATGTTGMRIELNSTYQNYIRFIGGNANLANTVAGIMGQTTTDESFIRIMPQLWTGQSTSNYARIDVINYRNASTGATDYYLDFHGDAFFQNVIRTNNITSKSGGGTALNVGDLGTPVNVPSLIKTGQHTVTITAANTNFTRSVTFPTAFPATGPVPTVVASPYDITGNVTMKVAVRNVTRSGFDIDVVRSSGTTNVEVMWIAVAQ